MTIQDQINASAAPAGQAFAQRVDAMNQAQTTHLGPDVIATLASAPNSDQSAVASASSATQTLAAQVQSGAADVLSAARTVFEDPVLHKQPSAALMLHQLITGQMGWQPVEQLDLRDIQQSMVSRGYLKPGQVTGFWGPDSQSAYYTMSQDHLNAQRTSNNGAGFSFSKALHGFLGALAPSHAIPAIVGAVKALPSQARNLAADTAGYALNIPHELGRLPHDITSGDISGIYRDASAAGGVSPSALLDASTSHSQTPGAQQAGAFIENIGNHQRITADQFESEHGFNRAVDNINVILSMLPMFKAGSTVADAGGQAIAKGLFTPLDKAAAQRGPGLISNLLYSPAGYYATNEGTQFVGERGLIAAKAFDHLPFLKQMMPAIRNVTADGQRYWYYTARPALAVANRIPIVRAGNVGMQQVMLNGALLRGDANAVNRIEGGHSEFANGVLSVHPYTGPLGFALDLYGGLTNHEGAFQRASRLPAATAEDAVKFANARAAVQPVINVTPSQTVGEAVKESHDTYDAMLGRPGILGAFDRGLKAAGFKDGVDSLYRASREAGQGDSGAAWHMAAKVDEFAASLAAQKQTAGQGLVGVEKERAFAAAQEAAMQDPDLLMKTRGELLANDAGLAVAVQKDASRISQRSDAAEGDLTSLMRARPVAYEILNDPEFRRQLITSGTFQALRDARDEAAFNATLAGEPKPPLPRPDRAWLAANNPTTGKPGSLGFARLDTLLKPDAKAAANQLEQRLAKVTASRSHTTEQIDAGTTTTMTVEQRAAETKEIMQDAGRLALQMHVDPASLPNDPEALIAAVRARAEDLAAPIATPLDATPELQAKLAELKGHGYRLIEGTGIGHHLSPPVIDPVLVQGGITAQRKVAEALGLGSTYSDIPETAAQHRLATVARWQAREDKGQVAKLPGWTWDHVLSHVQDNLPDKNQLSGARGAMFKLRSNRWRNMAKAMLPEDATDEQVNEKLATIEQQLASHRSMLDVSQKEFVAALRVPPKGLVNFLSGLDDNASMFTEEQGRLLYQDMISAAKDTPMWMAGLSKLDGFTRAGLSWMGAPAANHKIISRVAVMPNDLIRYRNKVRFDLDPEFAARRVTKQAFKLSLQGAPFTVAPFEAMVKQGTLNDDLALAHRLFPEDRGAALGWDNMDRALYDADLAGIYNPRHFLAYGAGWFKRMGMTDEQVKAQVTKALTYGPRTALERSVGTIFYPFSFEKTLYRNLGGYLLDNAGQRFLLTGALQAYDALSKHVNIGKFLKDHAPILDELNRLNAFDHGVGPGQFGGINAPYGQLLWNVLGPQHIKQPSDQAVQAWQTAIPMLGELNRMLLGYSASSGKRTTGILQDQLGVTYHAAVNGVDDVTRKLGQAMGGQAGWGPFDGRRSPWNPQAPALDYQGQQTAANQMRNNLILTLAGTIDYNYHHPSAPAKFADTREMAQLGIAGLPVDRTTIGQLVHGFFPEYDPAKSQSTAVAKQQERTRFLQQLKVSNTAKADAYLGFVKQADRFNTLKNRLDADPKTWSTLSTYTREMRAYAASVAEQDPTFLRFYNLFFVNEFGPLEDVTR